MGEDFTLPSMWEMASIYINKYLVNSSLPTGNGYLEAFWTSSAYSVGASGKAWYYHTNSNALGIVAKSERLMYYCTLKQ